MAQSDLGQWFILRTASADTLKLAKALTRRGHRVWTPIERRYGRKPRTKAHYDKEFALMPSYVFADVHALPGIQALADRQANDLPRFSLFIRDGGVPMIDDMQLTALRYYEEKLQRAYEKRIAEKRPLPKFNEGQIVRIKDGGFAGLDATVCEQQGQFTIVSMQGCNHTIKVSTLLLLDDSVGADNEIAAQAA